MTSSNTSMITIQPYEDAPEGQLYQYPSLQVDGEMITYDSSETTLSDWIDTRIMDASFLCKDITPMKPVGFKVIERMNRISKTKKERIFRLSIEERHSRIMDELFKRSNNSLICINPIGIVRVNIQRNVDNEFTCHDVRMKVISNLFNSECQLEIGRFSAFLPQGCGLDGSVLYHNHKNDIPIDINRRDGLDEGLEFCYIVSDIISPDLRASERLDILGRMCRKYTECFGAPTYLSLMDYCYVTSKEEAVEFLSTHDRCILLHPTSLYDSTTRLDKKNFVGFFKNENPIEDIDDRIERELSEVIREQEMTEVDKKQKEEESLKCRQQEMIEIANKNREEELLEIIKRQREEELLEISKRQREQELLEIKKQREQELIEAEKYREQQLLEIKKQREQELIDISKQVSIKRLRLVELDNDLNQRREKIKLYIPPINCTTLPVKLKIEEKPHTIRKTSTVKTSIRKTSTVKTSHKRVNTVEVDHVVVNSSWNNLINRIIEIKHDILLWLDRVHARVIRTEEQCAMLRIAVLLVVILALSRVLYYSM